MAETYRRTVAFADRCVEIISEAGFGEALCNALFLDVPSAGINPAHHTFRIVADGATCRLLSADDVIYTGESVADLGSFLVGEVIYHLTDRCDSGLVLHAAALCRPGMALAMPAESGSGKTTLTGHLLTRGFGYLTDELIHVPSGTATINTFTRPLNFKRPAFEVVLNELNIDCEASDCVAGSWASLVPHRKLGEPFEQLTPELTHLVFPKYTRDTPATISHVSTARAAMFMMGCLVNARNLPEHGFDEITRLARSVDAISITYQSFADVDRLLLPELGLS